MAKVQKEFAICFLEKGINYELCDNFSRQQIDTNILKQYIEVSRKFVIS